MVVANNPAPICWEILVDLVVVKLMDRVLDQVANKQEQQILHHHKEMMVEHRIQLLQAVAAVLVLLVVLVKDLIELVVRLVDKVFTSDNI